MRGALPVCVFTWSDASFLTTRLFTRFERVANCVVRRHPYVYTAVIMACVCIGAWSSDNDSTKHLSCTSVCAIVCMLCSLLCVCITNVDNEIPRTLSLIVSRWRKAAGYINLIVLYVCVFCVRFIYKGVCNHAANLYLTSFQCWLQRIDKRICSSSVALHTSNMTVLFLPATYKGAFTRLAC